MRQWVSIKLLKWMQRNMLLDYPGASCIPGTDLLLGNLILSTPVICGIGQGV